MINLSLRDTSSLEEAIEKLNDTGCGFLAIIDKNGKLSGILIDGDIRRGFLNGSKELKAVMNTNPQTMEETSTRKQALYQMKKSHKKHMPIVNKFGSLVDVIMLDEESFNVKPNWVVIMAGGLGTRLGDLTSELPKPMLPLGGKPMLERILELFTLSGFTKFIISVNFKSSVIIDYFKDGADLGVEICYVQEKKRLGTAGSLSLIESSMIDEMFIVVNGDVITSLDYDELLAAHHDSGADATMCVKEHSFQIPYGVISTDVSQNIIVISEKPIHNYYVNAGVYAFDPTVLELFEKGEHIDMTDFFRVISSKGKTSKTFLIRGQWADVGFPSDYFKTDHEFSGLSE